MKSEIERFSELLHVRTIVRISGCGLTSSIISASCRDATACIPLLSPWRLSRWFCRATSAFGAICLFNSTLFPSAILAEIP